MIWLKREALAGAHWPGFDNSNLVANLGFVLLVVRHELLADGVLLAVQRVGLAGLHGYDNGLVGLMLDDTMPIIVLAITWPP